MNTHTKDQHTITLNDHDWQHLMFALGAATVIAQEGRGVLTFRETILLSNAVNKDNPNFLPYKVPNEQRDSLLHR